ncbi:MAG: type II toxin-antitoxin system VapC family toxin [Woronichinia naegeliana WA131]|jgi:predicted nucleic acid-binding protein|uniref:Type II toxin-antitoxin system VapC family toxin n=1 Tax=Woronichinia naegeliana WA131 TaxID=2824559 RepID=A0A977L2U6_9CYAN|nr:MAG: type II toxin-antitoxin system VapC family toxin [Woronichinia naegeliana WA131]
MSGQNLMASSTIVDTDIIIDVGRGIPEAVNCMQELKSTSRLAISIVTQMELIVGCANKSELRTLEKFLQQFDVVTIDPPISDKAVDLLRLYRLSHCLLIADGLIAATAIIWNYPFISKNQRDYRFIQNLNLLPYPYKKA